MSENNGKPTTKYTSLFQCFQFLARNEATISLAVKDACTHRCVIRIGEELATIEYDVTEPKNLVTAFIGPCCSALQAHIEGD